MREERNTEREKKRGIELVLLFTLKSCLFLVDAIWPSTLAYCVFYYLGRQIQFRLDFDQF
jgi:hypothetical protein